MRYRLTTIFMLVLAVAAFLTVGQSSGYWTSAGLLGALLLISWRLRSRKRGPFFAIRATFGLLGLATIWFLGVDRSEFVEGCDDCSSGRFISQYRFLGFPITTDVSEARSTIDLALADLGAPCKHRSRWRNHTHRSWGLLVCGYPCFDGLWGLGGGHHYTSYTSAAVRTRGKADPAFAAELHRRVIDQDDKSYFWDGFMTDVLAPEMIAAPNTRDALSWLKGSSEADYRSLSLSMSNEASIKWVEEAYAAGATKVFAVEIEPYGWDGTRSVKCVLIKLPSEVTPRAQLIDWLSQQYKNKNDSPRDYGQSFIEY